MQTSVYDFCGYKNESDSVELSLYRQILRGNHYYIIFKNTFLSILAYLVTFVGSKSERYNILSHVQNFKFWSSR